MRLLLFLAVAVLAAAQPYDLLLKGGHVIDPKNKITAIRDVAIAGGRIAEVATDIAASKARKTVDVHGLYVTPGLIDIHVHVYAGTGAKSIYAGDLSVYPDGFTFRSGVTTVVDAGTSGWRNFPDFRQRVIDRAKTRVFALINIVSKGMSGEETVEQDTSEMDPKATADMALRNKDVVVGFKTAHFRGPEWTSVDRALEAGRIAKLPIMVDFGKFLPERPYADLVTKRLRPGDISTHCYRAAIPMLDENGRVRPYLREARKRGVIFDVGHGGGSFVFGQAVPAVQQGFLPHSISTDLHGNSMNAGMKDMLNVMSKFLNMGMSIDDVVLRSTWNPAREIHHEELGNLTVGAPADVTVLSIEHGKYGFVDCNGARLRGTQRLAAEATIRAGKLVWDLNGIAREDWNKLPKHYPVQGDGAWDATIGAAARAAR
jgi:dihydroorotase